VIDEFSGGLTPMNSFPNEITAGNDGNVWFTDDGTPSAIGRATPSGVITEFTTGLNAGSEPDSITAGPGRNVWFADQAAAHRAIGRVTPAGVITEFSNGLSTSLPDDIVTGVDGNLWIAQSMTPAIARVTPSGVITEFRHGLNSGGGSDQDQIVSGPDGNLWFNDAGTPKAIGRVALQLAPTVTKARFGNQQIKLTTPSRLTCTAKTQTLSATLSSTAISKSHATKLRFASAAFYFDKGGRHALAHHVPASLKLRLAGLSSRSHTLKVKASYRETLTRHGHAQTVTVTRALTVKFRVC
jgi:streptogramin lyase